MIYFVQAVDGGRVKVGTTIRLSQRLRTLEIQEGAKLRVLGVMGGFLNAERAIHDRFESARAEGEWFDPTPDLLAFIAEHAAPWDGIDDAVRLKRINIHIDFHNMLHRCAVDNGQSMTEYTHELLCRLLDRPDLLDSIDEYGRLMR